MMRITTVLGLVLIAAFAAPAFGQSPFLGKWTATAHAPGGDASESVTVEKTSDGYAVTAKRIGAPDGAPEAGPGTDIVLNGDSFAYKRTLTTPGGTLVITYTGIVSGDTFTGMVDIGGFAKMPYTGVRIKNGG
jgi:hypothetical protein